MSRERLTSRTAEDMKSKPGTQVEAKGSGIDNDPYNMNDTGHEKNDPKMEAYGKGDPSAWAEDVNKDKANKDDQKREETGHAPLIDKHAAAEAVASAKRLEEKAVKCIIAAQRILPGATEEMIEKQAAILMHLPEEGLNATLSNQEELAKSISKQAGDIADEAKAEGESEEQEKKEKEVAEENKEEEIPPAKKKASELEETLAGLMKQASDLQKAIEAMNQNAKANDNWPAGKKTEKKAGEEEEKKEDEKKEEKPEEKAACDEKKEEKKEEKAAAEEVKEEEKKEDEKKEDKDAAEEKKEEEVEASDANLLDQIFGEVTASETKKGATKLSGMVKKEASQQVNDLSSLWASAPDVSTMF